MGGGNYSPRCVTRTDICQLEVELTVPLLIQLQAVCPDFLDLQKREFSAKSTKKSASLKCQLFLMHFWAFQGWFTFSLFYIFSKF